jgi:ABC-type multidrug transport system fused ATPase/permease subunit
MKPVLDTVLGESRGGLREMAVKYNPGLPGWLRLSEGVVAGLPRDPFQSVAWIMLGLGVLTVVGACANFLHQYFALTVVSRTVARVRREVFAHVVNLPLATVMGAEGGRGASDAVSRVVNDTATLSVGFNAVLSKALAQLSKGVAAFGAAMVVNPWVAVGVVPVAVVMGVVIKKLGTRIRRASRKALASQSGLYAAAAAAMAGLRVVKVHTTEMAEAARFGVMSDEVVKQELKMRTARALASPLVELLAIVVLGGLVLGGVWVILEKGLDARGFVLAIGALGGAGAQLKPLTGLINDVQQSSGAASRIVQVLGLAVEGPRGEGVPRLMRHKGSVRFEGVRLTYPGAAEASLRGVTLEVPAGATYAFVGPNGSGKTSLLSLVPRLFDPDVGGGRVLVDGVDVRGVELSSLRSQVGVVTQETVLFSGTIGENIAYGSPRATEGEVLDAARRARALGFIEEKGGLSAPVGEGGNGLSGGQRQRLAIARAILRDPAILILDEATSMIDAESEAQIAAALREFVEGSEHGKRTCLIVAHRLSTVVHADQIVVMEGGRVADVGKHAELLERCPVYRGLAERQLMG